jgi:hypothetical protein
MNAKTLGYQKPMSNENALDGLGMGPHEMYPDHRYSRAHDWLFDGGPRVRASASPRAVSPPLSDLSAPELATSFSVACG